MKNIALLTAFLVCLAWDSYGQSDNKPINTSSSLNSIPEQIKNRKSYKRIEWFNTQRAWPNETIPVTQYAQEMTNEIIKVRSNRSKQNDDLTWTSLGPTGVQSLKTNFGIVSGRVKTLAVHPTDPNTVYIGAANGGIWKTTDGGQSWLDIGHGLESLSFGAIAIDPNNPETIFAGSGESCFNLGYIQFDGKGIFKSINGGETWAHITNGIGTVTSFSDLAVSPFNSNLVIGALASGYSYSGNLPNEGIWRSNDAGETWVRTLDVQDAYDIAFHPTDVNKVFAAVGSGESTAGFYISTDQGATWIQSNTGLPPTSQMHRLQIDVSKSNPDIVYAVIFNVTTMFTKAYKSVNGGRSLAQIAVGTNLGGYFYGWSDQGFFDLCIAVDPENPDLAYIGNIEIHRTINGSSFSPVRPYGGNDIWSGLAHNDYHKLVFAPSDPDYFYIGCDGGVYKSIDRGYNATSQNQGLETLQLYRIASHPLNPEIFIGGMQDNCTAMTSDGGQTWKEVTAGDGMECLFNPNPDTIYTSWQNGGFFRSINGGISFSSLFNANGSWITPIIMHPINHQILYTANTSILKTTNGGNSFQVIASQVSPELIVSMALSTVNPDNMIFASGGTQWPVPGNIIVVKVSTDGGYNWTDVTSNIPGEPRWISRVLTDPVDASTMYTLRTGFSPGNKVWKTTNLGQTWTNISGNLPDLPVNDLFIDPDNTARLYLANDIGVYLSEDGGTTWNFASESIPFVPCMDFDYIKIDTREYLRVGTFGRSIYEIRMGYGFGTEEPVGSSRQLTVDSYPNPFASYTTLEYELEHDATVKLSIYNYLGQQVAILVNGEQAAGKQRMQWEAEGMPAGIYFYRLIAGSQSSTGKMVVLK